MGVRSVLAARLGQYQLALVSAAAEGVRQVSSVRAAAAGAFVFAGATGDLERIFLEVRTLLTALVQLVSTFKSDVAGPRAVPAPIRHILVVSYAIVGGHRRGSGIVGDGYASASVVD